MCGIDAARTASPKQPRRKTVKTSFTELELDALRELANIGSGNAATALSSMVGRPVDVSVPNTLALPLADVIDEIGSPDSDATGIVLPIVGELEAVVLMLFTTHDAGTLCSLLGVEAGTDFGRSALGEVGNIIGTAYVYALSAVTGLMVEPAPPQTATDMLGAIVESVIAESAAQHDLALLLDSDLVVENEACSFSFVLVPTAESVGELLRRLGLG
jgi:chemotaxis protein CheC